MTVTLVSHYGPKSPAFESFLQTINALLGKAFGRSYSAYASEQVHATLVGLEQSADNHGLVNHNYLSYRQQRRLMDLAGLIRHLKTTPLLPMDIHIGGFCADMDYGFQSQGQHPMQRTFSIQADKVVCIGWPGQQDQITLQLVELRKSLEPFNILHKWHRRPDDGDNDLYFVLGLLDRADLDLTTIGDVENNLRQQFATQPPLSLTISAATLQFVDYQDLTLPPGSSLSLPLMDVDDNLANLLALFER